MTAASRFVVRCFATEDEALVDEWPVVLDEEAVRAIVGPVTEQEIYGVDHAAAEKLIGHPIEAFAEAVEYFVEPAEIAAD